MKTALRFLGLALLLLTASLSAAVPALQGRVNDYAGLLRQDEIERLESKLEAYERETSNQFVLLTVKSLDGDSIEGYAGDVFHAWKLGQADADNGVLVLFSLGERKLRIEVGYGLEGTIPDSVAGSILRERIAVHTKQNRFYQGFDSGFDALMAAANGEYHAAGREGKTGLGVKFMLFILFIALFFIALLDDPWWLLCSAALGFMVGWLRGSSWLLGMAFALVCVFAAWVLRVISSSRGSGGFLGSDGNGFSSGKSSDSSFSGGGGDSGGGGASGDG